MREIIQKKLEKILTDFERSGLTPADLIQALDSTFDIRQKVPVLDTDKRLYEQEGGLFPRLQNERAVAFALLTALEEAGFKAVEVDDGGDENILIDQSNYSIKEVMENMFGVDECHVHVMKEGFGTHWIYFVYGNADDGSEVIADWSFYEDDRDGFNAAMDAFDPEQHATSR